MDDLVRQLMVKMAYTPAPLRGNLYNPAYRTASPEEYGQMVSRDIQTYGHLAPGSEEYNLAMQRQGFTPEYMQGISSAGQRLLSAAGNPEFVRGMQAGTANVGDLYSDLKSPTAALGGWKNTGKYLLSNPIDSARAAYREYAEPGQFGRALASNVSMDSPLARAAKAKGVTTYLNSKIQDLSNRFGGGFGKNIGGALSFLLGLITKVPGYDMLANKLVDWTGAGRPKALPAAAPVKAGSHRLIAGSPYSHYRTIRTRCGSEVLTLWNRQ